MKNKNVVIAVIAAIVIIGVLGLALFKFTGKKADNSENGIVLKFENAQEMKDFIGKLYDESKNEMFGLETREIELDDEMALESYTGLKSSKDINKVVVSESMITSTAYSLALVEVKDGADLEAIKKEMVDNIDMRRWICVSADVVLATNNNNVIFMVMSEEENAKEQYEAFKKLVNNKIGKELRREAEAINFDF